MTTNEKFSIVFDNLTGFSKHEQWTAENIVKEIRMNVIYNFCQTTLEDIEEMSIEEIKSYLRSAVTR